MGFPRLAPWAAIFRRFAAETDPLLRATDPETRSVVEIGMLRLRSVRASLDDTPLSMTIPPLLLITSHFHYLSFRSARRIYCQRCEPAFLVSGNGAGVLVRSRSRIAEWHTMQDCCVRLPS